MSRPWTDQEIARFSRVLAECVIDKVPLSEAQERVLTVIRDLPIREAPMSPSYVEPTRCYCGRDPCWCRNPPR